MKRILSLSRILALTVAAAASFQASSAAQPGEAFADFTDDGGWCWFSDPRALSRDGRTFSGWVKEDGSIEAASIDHATGRIDSFVLHDGYERDDHDNPSFLFLPDGRLRSFYSKHGKVAEINTRVTTRPGDVTAWEPVVAIKPIDKSRKNSGITYSNPFMLSGENNTIYLFWRGISYKPTMAKSTDGGNTWSEARPVISTPGLPPGNRPYAKYASNGRDRIHIIFTDGHPRDERTNSVYYVCYRDGAFYKADGTRICGAEELPIDPAKADRIYDAAPSGARAWVWEVAFDEKDQPVVVYTRIPSEEDHRYHYARWNGREWADTELCAAGKWFPQTRRGQKESEPHYSSGLALDPADPSTVYLTRPVNGVREVEKWTTPDAGKTWKSEAITANSKHDNIRPFVVRNHDDKGPLLLWQSISGRYTHFTDYLCSIKMDRPGKVTHHEQAALPPLSSVIEPKAVLGAMERVADWQLAHPSKHRPDDWTQGAGYTGMMALDGISGSRKYRDAMMAMGEANSWKPGPSVYHADDHCVGMTYAELYIQLRDPKMIAPLKERFDFILANPQEGTLDFKTKGNQQRWSWCDSLFMAPPAWLRLYVATGDKRYLDLAVNHWWRTSDFLYDKQEQLYFRDSTYFPKREANGKKVFWGRGNGWVMGGLVRMLQYLPSNHPDRKRFEQQFKEMSAKLLTCQQSDGLWRASLLDPASYPLKETSSSGFCAYAFAWGVNQGLLDRKSYEPAVRKAWSALVGCVRNNGKLTHVQPIGADPQNFPDGATEVYGTGAFLLAGTEIYRMAVLGDRKPHTVAVGNPTDFSRSCETVEVEVPASVKQPVVMDALTSRVLDSQIIGGKLLFQVDLAPGEARNYLILSATRLSAVPTPDVKTHARFVPERLDDFAWESDRIAHRTYGPAINIDPKEKLVSSGIDVWVKSGRRLVIDKWYKSGDYHADKGEGLDCYKVGPARGCGGSGIWDGKKLHPSSNFKTWKVLANGPIRSVFELAFEDWDAAGRKVSEIKRISIDAGSNFSRVESTFQSPKPGNLTVAVGISRRPGDGVFSKDAAGGWMSYWEPEAAPNGNTACAVVIPGGLSSGFAEADGHYLALGTATPGKPFVHYIGAGWSKSGDFPDVAAWEAHVRQLAARLKSPLKVKVK